ncbi:protein-glutamate O-methyltransferase CheR [Parashewanella curva]|uniref:protein-glutamate O-methyltransferase n=1 Tax=Parashewanella curva TaxID=2338552 RepID=A0A3L8Q357_9GAMM|nr:protein-glutamate O-methyltransferase CheR [Parashewanella curva]RLV61579.1 protein-glutamate O-methyltransferase CheR [Parashewanella curva]
MSQRQLTQDEYKRFSAFLEQHSGIVLGDNKQYLVRSRLSPLVTLYGLSDIAEVAQKSIDGSLRQLRLDVIDAMTTNETLWFRDGYPFSLLESTIFPEYSDQSRSLKIWSAACSSGQEPYSIAMSALEYKQKNPTAFARGVSILGTDLSPTMLEKCSKAEYDELALARGLSEQRKRQFFESSGQAGMRVKQNVRDLVSFRNHNLLDNYNVLGKFDVIFCRNVLIYFSPAAKSKILRQFAAALNPNGVLFLGASESMTGLCDDFEMIRCRPGIFYRKKS